MTSSLIERRWARRSFRTEVEINGHRAVTTDVSPGGFGATLSHAPQPGSHVYGVIHLDRHAFSYSGQVEWVRGGNDEARLGVRFNDIENGYLSYLGGYQAGLPRRMRLAESVSPSQHV